MEQQTKGLPADIRGCATQQIQPAGDEEILLAGGAPRYLASLQILSINSTRAAASPCNIG
jgi:hypothetical protein